MTLEEYYNLSNIFFSTANRYGYFNHINTLKNSIVSIKNLRINAGNPQIQQQIQNTKNQLDTQRNQVLSSMQSTRAELISNGSYNTFFEGLIGEEREKSIGSITNALDINNLTLLDTLESILTANSQFYSFWSTVTSTKNLFDIEIREIPLQDCLSIIFENDAFIDDLKSLSKATEDWNFIIHSFGRLTNENDTKAEVISVIRGSLILTIGAATAIIGGITKSSNLIMDSILKALKIKEKILELRKLGIENTSIELDLIEKKATIKINTLATDITTKLLEDYQKDPTKSDYKEIEVFTRRSVKRLILFNSKGGKLEPKLISPNEEQKEQVTELTEKNKNYKLAQELINNIAGGKEPLLIEGNLDEEEKTNESDQLKNTADLSQTVSDLETKINNQDNAAEENDEDEIA